ncbi:hypothetical protein Mpsy_2443 [Methanolobus psychrophilus R15]|nr:hypothetical protein Mpsy_2443 [Methanolobus psychrophilus R15]
MYTYLGADLVSALILWNSFIGAATNIWKTWKGTLICSPDKE